MSQLYAVLLAVALQVLFGCASASMDVRAPGDATFTKYLEDTMAKEYGKWIKESNLDPSPPITDTVTLPPPSLTISLQLNCTIKNQIISGHSNGNGDVGLAETYLDSHVFAAGREVHTPYECKGNYNCSGLLYAWAFDELTSDLPFVTIGNFAAKINSSDELIEYVNFGVTENYTLNKTNSWFNYLFIPGVEQVSLMGTWGSWDNATIDKYSRVVEGAFRSSYSNFLSRENLPQTHLNPSRQVFVKYVDEVIMNTKLTEVLSQGELPPPFFPKPRP